MDVLRVLGIFMIILAHISLKEDENSLLFNIRNFDVVLLVFISGLSSIHSVESINSLKEYFAYLLKRFKRLIIPGWSFITIYYLYAIVMERIYESHLLNIKSIILSYTMIGGMGYVWIIRVLFCMAVIVPLYYIR